MQKTGGKMTWGFFSTRDVSKFSKLQVLILASLTGSYPSGTMLGIDSHPSPHLKSPLASIQSKSSMCNIAIPETSRLSPGQ